MSNLQAPRGTRDILPEEQATWEYVKGVAAKIAKQFGFQQITTPTYEYRTLFERSIGNDTDVMSKELFLVRGPATTPGEEEYALRPEGTAGIVRAFIEHGMHLRPQPIKLWNFVNNFRYDRPQKGRYREHVQFDLELFGETGPFADAWIIFATYAFLKELGLQGLSLELNTLGTNEERAAYQDVIRTALNEKTSQLSQDSQARLTSNPLRILDSKDANDQALLNELPDLLDFCGDETKRRFEQVQRYLTTWEVPFRINKRLVRGLDYYSHTAFEWITEGAGGQQSALGGGGRYDGLLTKLGGQNGGAVGAGIGLDRVVEEVIRQNLTPEASKSEVVAVILASASAEQVATKLIKQLLEKGLCVIANFDRESMGSQLKAAHKQGAQTAYILGDQELADNTITIKNLETGEQQTSARNE